MKNLFKYLKPYAASIVAILAVLVLQAYCDLSLPAYTSDIVNVGIQQGGVDTSIPRQISVKKMDQLFFFLSKEDQEVVRESYQNDHDTYKKDAYVLKEKALKDDSKMEKLKKIDQAAYIRFASVYRQFKDINSFMQELSMLLEKKD
ncbi:MAG: hypothetical protein RRY25_09000 [Anaerovorax sp.]